mmetsp:Transcript_5134/g.15232  ORF Transcript_5134/g.15232 Transcript_5134/m.15232 type:complete len:223 (-) Transcript_5134:93-761(-)
MDVSLLTTWRAVLTALVVVAGYATVYGLFLCRRRSDPGQPEEAEEEEADKQADSKKAQGSSADYPDRLPADRVFTLETLAPWDGRNLPMCLCVCGKVVDVSSSPNFSPDFGYGKLWGGRDASYALARASLEAEDANVLEWDLEELEQPQRDSLLSFYKHFVGKYPIIGTLKEYEHRDFSAFLPEEPAAEASEKAAEPAAGAGSGKTAKEAAAEPAAEPSSKD